jgi:hypothetical protein
MRIAIGIASGAALLCASVVPVRADLLTYTFTGQVTVETLTIDGASVTAPHLGMEVSGTFSFDTALAPIFFSEPHHIANNSAGTAVDFVSSTLHFADGTTFSPLLSQPAQGSHDAIELKDNFGSGAALTDRYFLADGNFRPSSGPLVENASLTFIFQQQADPAPAMLNGLTYSQTPKLALATQTKTGSYFSSDGHTVLAGDFQVTSFTLVPEPSSVSALLAAFLLMGGVARHRSYTSVRSASS